MSIEGDTYEDPYVPSGLPRVCGVHPGAPDDRGFGAGIPEHTFASGPSRLDGGEVSTRFSLPVSGGGGGGSSTGGGTDGGTP